jgi:prepilin-type N-terminal cleavage/methylation domain-containing protein
MMRAFIRSKSIKRQKGFSLVEMMVVVSVFIILAAIATPSFTGWLANYRLKVAASDVRSALQLAKSTALKENADVVIWFNTANNTYRAYLDNGVGGGGIPGNQTQDGSERTVKDGTLEGGVDMYSTSFSTWSNQTYFNSRGLADGGWGYVDLKSDSDKYRRITVWTTGHIKIFRSKDGSSWS